MIHLSRALQTNPSCCMDSPHSDLQKNSIRELWLCRPQPAFASFRLQSERSVSSSLDGCVGLYWSWMTKSIYGLRVTYFPTEEKDNFLLRIRRTRWKQRQIIDALRWRQVQVGVLLLNTLRKMPAEINFCSFKWTMIASYDSSHKVVIDTWQSVKLIELKNQKCTR
jgi:hypothetical protein